MQGPKWPLFYSHLDPVWSLLIIRTCFVLWVEIPVQRRLCPFGRLIRKSTCGFDVVV